MTIWFALTFFASNVVNGKTYLGMQMLCFPTNLAIIVIAYLSAIQLIVELLLYSADYIFSGWYPGPSVLVPSFRRHLRLKPKFNPHDHL